MVAGSSTCSYCWLHALVCGQHTLHLLLLLLQRQLHLLLLQRQLHLLLLVCCHVINNW
jgi:hypothetical protein